MARPQKQAHEKRDQRFNLRLTLAEIEHVRSQAALAGLEPHDYVRRRVIEHKVSPSPARESDPALISEINRIGVNVNQLARSAHRGSDFVQYWQEVGAELQTVMKKIMRPHGS